MYNLIAHRGIHNKYKENTINAFKEAIDSSEYLGFECDVRQTKDNYFVIYHNPLYEGKLIKTLKYEELKEVPLLNDILNLKTDKIIMLDIKDPFLNIELFKHELLNSKLNLYIISFYDNVIKKLNTINKNYKLGVLNYILNTTDQEFELDFLCIMGIVLNKNIINKFIKLEKQLFVYNIKKENIVEKYPFYIVD